MNAINNNNRIERDAVAPSRRQVLAGGGAVIVSCSLGTARAQ